MRRPCDRFGAKEKIEAMSRSLLVILAMCLCVGTALADGVSVRAQIDPGRSLATEDGRGLIVELFLTQAVPYRVYTLTDPARLVVDLRAVSWDGLQAEHFSKPRVVTASGFGQTDDGWSRLEIALARPLVVRAAGMETDPVEGAALISLRLGPTSEAEFRAGAVPPLTHGPDDLAEPLAAAPDDDLRLMVVLDPGHGGVDRGAEVEAEGGLLQEADLMLVFARELKETLLRTGRYDVTLTREDDEFLSLDGRVALAHRVGADVFLSLHADILANGGASGASVYTLSEDASDGASQELAERMDRADLLVGVDLTDHDDRVAGVLMDLARTETSPRTDHLARELVKGIAEGVGRINSRPRRSAGFSVLKAADIPSVLIEVGFLSDARDLADLTSPGWRRRAATGIRQALDRWALEDAAATSLFRN